MNKIWFLYNVRHTYPDINDKDTRREADYSDDYEIAIMIEEIKKAWYDVLAIEANEEAYQILRDAKHDLLMVLNYSEGLVWADRESQFPALMEILSIPYTWSKPLAQSLMLNKSKCNEILKANGILTLWNRVIKDIQDIDDIDYEFPLIVKPLSQGSSIAITNDSVVYNLDELKKQTKAVLDLWVWDVLIEQYINWKEFYVSMVWNTPQILPILEADYSVLNNNYKPINSFEVKRKYSNHIIKPANIGFELEEKIHFLCNKARNALWILDWCRFDVRCDQQGTPYILEVNSPAGITPSKLEQGYSSCFILSAKMAWLNYQDVIRKIIDSALQRYKNI